MMRMGARAKMVFCSRGFVDLCTELLRLVPNAQIWAASMFHEKCSPSMSSVTLTEPLRTPPKITREVQQSGYMLQGVVKRYTEVRAPPPCDGPDLSIVCHDAEVGHNADLTYDCVQCGREVAAILEAYQVGRPGGVCVCLSVSLSVCLSVL